MNPVVRKQYSLRQSPYYHFLGKQVALIDADSLTRSFYRQKLEQAHLLVKDFSQLLELEKELQNITPAVVIYTPQVLEYNQELIILSRFIQSYPTLPVVTLARTMQESQLDAIMKLGVRLHINRDLSHPRDLLIALEQVL